MEKCLKSKPRTYDAFKSEMQSCSSRDSRLSNLYNNVIVQNGEENRKVLYPTFSAGNQCYQRAIYKWVLEESEVAVANYNINLRLNLSNQPDLLSFEKESIVVYVNHSISQGFYASLGSSYYNNYYESRRYSNSFGQQIALDITPTARKQINLTRSIAPKVYCNVGQNQLQLDGADLQQLKEIVSAKNAKVSLSYTDVKGPFNQQVSGKWPYAQFTSSDLINNGDWSRPITEIQVSSGSKIKYTLNIENSRYYAGSIEEVIKCQ